MTVAFDQSGENLPRTHIPVERPSEIDACNISRAIENKIRKFPRVLNEKEIISIGRDLAARYATFKPVAPLSDRLPTLARFAKNDLREARRIIAKIFLPDHNSQSSHLLDRLREGADAAASIDLLSQTRRLPKALKLDLEARLKDLVISKYATADESLSKADQEAIDDWFTIDCALRFAEQETLSRVWREKDRPQSDSEKVEAFQVIEKLKTRYTDLCTAKERWEKKSGSIAGHTAEEHEAFSRFLEELLHICDPNRVPGTESIDLFEFAPAIHRLGTIPPETLGVESAEEIHESPEELAISQGIENRIAAAERLAAFPNLPHLSQVDFDQQSMLEKQREWQRLAMDRDGNKIDMYTDLKKVLNKRFETIGFSLNLNDTDLRIIATYPRQQKITLTDDSPTSEATSLVLRKTRTVRNIVSVLEDVNSLAARALSDEKKLELLAEFEKAKHDRSRLMELAEHIDKQKGLEAFNDSIVKALYADIQDAIFVLSQDLLLKEIFQEKISNQINLDRGKHKANSSNARALAVSSKDIFLKRTLKQIVQETIDDQANLSESKPKVTFSAASSSFATTEELSESLAEKGKEKLETEQKTVAQGEGPNKSILRGAYKLPRLG